MNLKLKRLEFNENGIFGCISTNNGISGQIPNEEKQLFASLEHSYKMVELGGVSFIPKLPNGTYSCKRGPHRLHGMTTDFETFEVTGVPGHAGILFHVGNYNRDSEGCILLGMAKHGDCVMDSKKAFAQFLELQAGIDEFILVVE